jgi:hypothetical protein
MKYSSGCWLVVMLALLVGSAGWAAEDQESGATGIDVVVPNTGHQLFGRFQRATADEIVFSLDCGPVVTFSWNQVKELQVRHKTTLQAKNPISAVSALKSVDLDSFTIVQRQGTLGIETPGRGFTVAQADLISITLPAAALPTTAWTLSIGSSASLISESFKQQIWGAEIDVGREQNPELTDWRHQATTLTLGAVNSLTEQGGIALRYHRYDGMFEQRVYLWRGLYTNVVAVGYSNSSDGMYLQQAYGGGLGVWAFRNDRQSLDLTGDLLYIAEHFYGPSPSVSFAGAGLREKYTIKLADVNKLPIELAETVSYIPAFNQEKAWQVLGAATLAVPITASWNANLTFKDGYLANAPKPANKNWSASSVGLTYTFPIPK